MKDVLAYVVAAVVFLAILAAVLLCAFGLIPAR